MDMFRKNQNKESTTDYYSAEFQLNQSRIMYQFKLRKSTSEPMFAVVKEGSKALETIQEGDVVDMLFRYLDNSLPPEPRLTRIKYICKDTNIGFKDHYVVGLSLDVPEERSVA
jgi:hypothetical protein